MSFTDLDAEVREIAAAEVSEGFESSILNLQRHQMAVA
jgi:hypothetical protein